MLFEVGPDGIGDVLDASLLTDVDDRPATTPSRSMPISPAALPGDPITGRALLSRRGPGRRVVWGCGAPTTGRLRV